MEVSSLDDLLATLPVELLLVLILVLLNEVHHIHFLKVLILSGPWRYLALIL